MIVDSIVLIDDIYINIGVITINYLDLDVDWQLIFGGEYNITLIQYDPDDNEMGDDSTTFIHDTYGPPTISSPSEGEGILTQIITFVFVLPTDGCEGENDVTIVMSIVEVTELVYDSGYVSDRSSSSVSDAG